MFLVSLGRQIFDFPTVSISSYECKQCSHAENKFEEKKRFCVIKWRKSLGCGIFFRKNVAINCPRNGTSKNPSSYVTQVHFNLPRSIHVTSFNVFFLFLSNDFSYSDTKCWKNMHKCMLKCDFGQVLWRIWEKFLDFLPLMFCVFEVF